MSRPGEVKSIALFVAAAVLGLGGLALFVWQAYMYLKHGQWLGVSVTDGMILLWAWVEKPVDDSQVPELIRWAIEPQSWTGLHKILNFIPASLALIGLAFGLEAWGMSVRRENNL